MNNKEQPDNQKTLNVVCILWPIESSYETPSGRPFSPASEPLLNRDFDTIKRVERYIMFSTN